MQKKFLYTINGKEYLLIQELFSTNEGLQNIQRAVKQTDSIWQSSEKKGSIFTSTYFVCDILVPSDKILEYQKMTNPYL